MWGATTVVGAFALALVAMSFAFAGGAVIVAIPMALLAIGVAALVDFNRRRNQATSIHDHRERAESDKVDFTERDQQTLVSE
jgi:anti-sigma factor RsiW